jgi:hypothetical protein
MPLATSPTTDALAYTLASLRGLTPDEAIALALRAELERHAPQTEASSQQEFSTETILNKIRSLGPWQGPSSTQLAAELYDEQGLPQ